MRLTPAIWVSLFFLILLVRSTGGFQGLIASNVRVLTFATIIIFGIFTLWLQRQTHRWSILVGLIETIVQKDNIFHIIFVLLVVAISSGINFLLLPAYRAYQVFVDIPRLFPLIAPFVGWITTQFVLLYLFVLVIRVTNSEPSSPSTRSLATYIWLSFGSMILFLYLNSIFIVWFELRGFRLF